jgi:hypothetical protein
VSPAKVSLLLAHIAEQAEKRQYLNAAHSSAELTVGLIACLGRELRSVDIDARNLDLACAGHGKGEEDK